VSERDDDLLLEPPDEQVASVRDIVFNDVIAAHRAADIYNRERSLAGWWVGGIGCGIGVLATLALVVVVVTNQPQVRFTEIDDASGQIHESFGAKDAPAHFSDRVVNHYVAEYVGLREQFVWQTDSNTDRRVKLMSSPAQQAAYNDQKTKDDPASKYGVNGYALVSHFYPLIPREKGKDNSFEYEVPFVKSELLANTNQIKTTHMTARLVFSFHPEIPMASDQDRLDNEAGLYVISYTSSQD